MRPAVTLSAAHLVDADLVALAMRENLHFNACSCYMRLPERNVTVALRDEQNFFKDDFAPFLLGEKRNTELHPFGNLLLEACDIDDGEHLD